MTYCLGVDSERQCSRASSECMPQFMPEFMPGLNVSALVLRASPVLPKRLYIWQNGVKSKVIGRDALIRGGRVGHHCFGLTIGATDESRG